MENDWVGAHTGLLDQLAALVGAPGPRCGSTSRRSPSSPSRCAWTAGGSWCSTPARPTLSSEDGYNARRAECERAARALGVGSLSEADPAAPARLPDPLPRRVAPRLTENARVDATVAALRAGDLAAVGPLLDASHASLRDLYDASVPEVEAARERLLAAGAAGARMMGGGFGGAVLALFPSAAQPPPDARAVQPGLPARILG